MVGDVTSSSKRTQRPVKLAIEIAVVLVVVLCAGYALNGELGRVNTDRLRFEPGWFVLAAAGFLLLQLVHSELWRFELSALGSHLPPRRARAIWCSSALARYVPTSMLMPTMRIAMAQRLGVPKRRTVASLAYEAALALAGALVVAAYFVVQLPQFEGEPVRWLVVALPFVAVASLQPRVFGPLSAVVLRRVGRDPLPMLLPERKLLRFWAAYAASFVLAGLALFALSSALYPVEPSSLPQIVGAFAVGFSISLLAFILPGGLGAREAGLAAALAPVMPTGVAIAVAVIVRVLQIVIEIALAALTPVLARGERPATDSLPERERVRLKQAGRERAPEPTR
jgi:hypothetical protein